MAKKDPENYIALEGGYNMSMTAMVGNVSPEHMSSAKLKVRSRGEKIIELLQNIGDDATFISSILRRVGLNNLDEALDIITGEDFKKLVLEFLQHNFGTDSKPLNFTPPNLSSKLNGSKKDAPQVLRALNRELNKEQTIKGIKELIELGFTLTNISSILSGSGRRAPQAIRELMSATTIEGIKELIELGFTTHNLAHILHSSGIEASAIVKELIANKYILKDLLKGNAPSNISNDLSSIREAKKVTPKLQAIRDTAIDALIESIREETPGSNLTRAERQHDNR